MYKQTTWQDRVTEFDNRYREVDNHDGTITHILDEGEVIQVGTPQNETHFNNMENGIQDVTLAAQFLAVAFHRHVQESAAHEDLMDSEVLGEVHEVTLKNTFKAPFNSCADTPQTVDLTKNRKNLFYSVETEITSHKGIVGDIIISDKALNGFKIAYTGSGTEVKLTVRVKGGMT